MATEETVQATGETVLATEEVTKTFYLLPKFTSKRWKEGIYDAEHMIVSASMTIREEDLLTFNERVEVETRKLIFQYQLKYAEKEYELLTKEFQSIEEKLNRQRSSDAELEETEFVKPSVPVDKKPRKKPGRPKKTRSGSETDEKGASARESASEDQKSTKKRGKKIPSKSGSETDEKGASSDDTSKRLVRGPKKNPAKSKSGSETDKESSLEMEDAFRRSLRNKK